ncbi:MAG: methionyl-tRNA formyltransferase [Verrucomicrobia bacterium]|nr:methionyl-tRNA formyltransferase [Verrucomicrobiota bacterium]
MLADHNSYLPSTISNLLVFMNILFAGTSDIGIPSLRALMTEHQLVGLLTQPDRPVGRHQVLTAPATKQFLEKEKNSFPIFQPENLRDVSFLEKLRALQPEIIVTMSYGKILPRELLELPSVACLNIHTSLLPRHRGATPIQAAILAGDEETGVTIMHMAEGLDTGDILLQKKIDLAPNETAGSLTQRLAELAPEALLEALSLLEKGEAPRNPQAAAGITHTRQITRADAAIDVSRSAAELDRLIRAMNPKPGAHGTFQLPSGKTIALKIFSATTAATTSSEKPGSLFLSQDRELLLACGQGTLLLHEIQPEGRARMSSGAFASGHFS